MGRNRLIVVALLSATAIITTPTAAQAHSGTAGCLDRSVPLSVEESRLTFTLPDNSNPAVLQSKPFARQMIEGAGFQGFTPEFVTQLCNVRSRTAAATVVSRFAERLWRMAVDRAQQRGAVKGDLPYSDDRPLYWTRLEATAAIRQWTTWMCARFPISAWSRSRSARKPRSTSRCRSRSRPMSRPLGR